MGKVVLGILLCVPPMSAGTFFRPRKRSTSNTRRWSTNTKSQRLRRGKNPQDETKQDTEPWPAHAFIPRFLKLAEGNPADPGATDALLWVVNKAMNISISGGDFTLLPPCSRASHSRRPI